MQFMEDLGVQPVMHKFVADIELKKDANIQDMVKAGCIEIRDYEDYLITDEDRADYEAYFLDAYESMNRFDFPEGEDIYTYFCEDEGLGEIRSIYMAKKLGYEYFMSDDGGAKRLAKAFIKKLNVLNVFSALMECKKRGTSITLKQLNPTITNVFRERRDMLKVLQETYGE